MRIASTYFLASLGALWDTFSWVTMSCCLRVNSNCSKRICFAITESPLLNTRIIKEILSSKISLKSLIKTSINALLAFTLARISISLSNDNGNAWPLYFSRTSSLASSKYDCLSLSFNISQQSYSAEDIIFKKRWVLLNLSIILLSFSNFLSSLATAPLISNALAANMASLVNKPARKDATKGATVIAIVIIDHRGHPNIHPHVHIPVIITNGVITKSNFRITFTYLLYVGVCLAIITLNFNPRFKGKFTNKPSNKPIIHKLPIIIMLLTRRLVESLKNFQLRYNIIKARILQPPKPIINK